MLDRDHVVPRYSTLYAMPSCAKSTRPIESIASRRCYGQPHARHVGYTAGSMPGGGPLTTGRDCQPVGANAHITPVKAFAPLQAINAASLHRDDNVTTMRGYCLVVVSSGEPASRITASIPGRAPIDRPDHALASIAAAFAGSCSWQWAIHCAVNFSCTAFCDSRASSAGKSTSSSG